MSFKVVSSRLQGTLLATISVERICPEKTVLTRISILISINRMKKLFTFVALIVATFLVGCGGPASDGARVANLLKEASEMKEGYNGTDVTDRQRAKIAARLEYDSCKSKYSGDVGKRSKQLMLRLVEKITIGLRIKTKSIKVSIDLAGSAFWDSVVLSLIPRNRKSVDVVGRVALVDQFKSPAKYLFCKFV